MSRVLLSALSAVTLFTGTALFYLWKKNNHEAEQIIDRVILKNVLIKLRKRAYSTLREISFIVNHIRTLEGDLQVKKISEIFMRDGGSGEKKLQAIEALVLQQAHISQNQFQSSCNYYCHHDIEIKLLLQMFRKDLNMALEGVIESYHGPLPRFSAERVLKIQEQIIKRRMNIICKKFIEKVSNEQCLRLQAQIQEYLLQEGISHEKEPNQKLFMSLLEHYYRHDFEFKEKFQRLQMDMEMFMIEIESKYLNKQSEAQGEQQEEKAVTELQKREQLRPRMSEEWPSKKVDFERKYLSKQQQ